MSLSWKQVDSFGYEKGQMQLKNAFWSQLRRVFLRNKKKIAKKRVQGSGAFETDAALFLVKEQVLARE